MPTICLHSSVDASQALGSLKRSSSIQLLLNRVLLISIPYITVYYHSKFGLEDVLLRNDGYDPQKSRKLYENSLDFLDIEINGCCIEPILIYINSAP